MAAAYAYLHPKSDSPAFKAGAKRQLRKDKEAKEGKQVDEWTHGCLLARQRLNQNCSD